MGFVQMTSDIDIHLLLQKKHCVVVDNKIHIYYNLLFYCAPYTGKRCSAQ
jgi:hypothetical protein